jgi:hypothetical protein
MVIQQGRKDKVATLLWIAIASSINVVGTKGISAGGAFTLASHYPTWRTTFHRLWGHATNLV